MGQEVKIKRIQGAPSWITTFVDMISLLVTFFILLFTFSSLRDYEAFTFPKNILSTTSIWSQTGKRDMYAPDDDYMSSFDLARGARTPHSRSNVELLEQIGDLYLEHLESPSKAIAAYSEAVELATDNHKLLQKLLDLADRDLYLLVIFSKHNQANQRDRPISKHFRIEQFLIIAKLHPLIIDKQNHDRPWRFWVFF